MSGIFGLIDFDGRPLRRTTIDGIVHRARAWGRDGVQYRHVEGTLLGHALLERTPEDRYTAMPCFDVERQITVVAAGRLDNRDDVADALGLSHGARAVLSDGSLMAQAYLRWDDETPSRLFGDWMLAAWHAHDRRLWLARDHLGSSSLAYWHHESTVAFASDVEVLFAVPEIRRRLDEEQLGRYLTLRVGDIDRTFFADVKRIPPAHALTVTKAGRFSRRYWHPSDAAPVTFRADADYEQAFLDQFRRAVDTRLRSTRPIATQLSAGLDSGAVTALAAEALAARSETLAAFTAAPQYPTVVPGRITDEAPLASQTAARWPNIRHTMVQCVDACPVHAITSHLANSGEPLHGVTNLHWILGVFGAIRDSGAGVLLTGQLGNGSVSWDGGSAWWYHALRERPWAPWFPVRHLVTQAFDAHRWRRALEPAGAPWSFAAVASEPFVSRLEREGALEPNPDLSVGYRRLHPREERALLLDLNGPAVAALTQTWMSRFGLDVRDPTADVRLVEYCFGVPDRQYLLRGRSRMLLRKSMKGLMPASVLSGMVRGLQGADIAARLRASESVTAALDTCAANPAVCEYIDVARLRSAWQAVHASTGPALDASAFLLRGLTAGLFVHGVTAATGGRDAAPAQ